MVETPSKGRVWSPHRNYNPETVVSVDVSSAKKGFATQNTNTAKKFRTKTSKKGGSFIYSNFKINQNSL